MDDTSAKADLTPPPADTSAEVKPTLASLVAWDEATQGKPPIEAVPLADLRDLLTQHEGEVIARVKDETRTEYEERSKRERNALEQQGEAQADIVWAADLDKRLSSTDEAERTTANTEKEANRERYLRGMAFGYQRDKAKAAEAVQNEVLAAHYRPMLESLEKAGLTAVLDALKDETRIAGADNNPLLLMHQLGDAAGYERGLEEGKRVTRTAENADGSPSLTDAGSGNDTFAGIDRNAPGSGFAMMRRAAAARR